MVFMYVLYVVMDYLKQCQYFKQTITIYYKSKILLKITNPDLKNLKYTNTNK